MAQKTKDWFEEHPLYAVGRALDDWVKKKASEETDDRMKNLEATLRGLDVGSCACGRFTYMFRGKDKCAGCEPGVSIKNCACQQTVEFRRRRLVEWQMARAEAGLETTPEDLDAKRADLKLAWDTWSPVKAKEPDYG